MYMRLQACRVRPPNLHGHWVVRCACADLDLNPEASGRVDWDLYEVHGQTGKHEHVQACMDAPQLLAGQVNIRLAVLLQALYACAAGSQLHCKAQTMSICVHLGRMGHPWGQGPLRHHDATPSDSRSCSRTCGRQTDT